jgi:hypothetical protein
MELVRVDPNGLQEWVCTTCQRRLRFHWASALAPTVLEAGDESATHDEPRAELGLVAHPSGLSAIWLEAITQLDMALLAGGEDFLGD